MRRSVGAGLFALALAGCNNSMGSGALNFEGRHNIVTQAPLTIEGVVTVRNVGDREILINAPNDCLLALEAFSTPGRTGEPAWSTPRNNVCTADLKLMSLVPGDYYDYKITGTVPSTLPHGRYYLAVYGANSGNHIPVGVLDF